MIFSYTLLRDFENCPKQAFHKHVAKDLPKELASPEMRFGIDVHTAFEHRLGGKPFEERFQHFETYALSLATRPVMAEAKLGVTRAGEACGFFDKNCYFRGKVDAAVVDNESAFLVDWKTGKKREDPDELEIFGVLLQAMLPRVTKLTGRYVWLKSGEVGKEFNLSNTWEKWGEIQARCDQVETALGASFFPPRESGLCSYCPVKSCQFWRPRN